MAAEAFRGEFYQKVDSKARVSIPAAFRRILEAEDTVTEDSPRPRVYMVYGGKNRRFVECYSRAGADALAARIEAMELGSPERDRAVREKMGFAGDSLTGGGEAAFAGFTNRFKLYRREVYEAELAEEDDGDGVDPLALVGRAARVG